VTLGCLPQKGNYFLSARVLLTVNGLYSRALRAHYLTLRVLMTLVLERMEVENIDDLKAELKSKFMLFTEGQSDIIVQEFLSSVDTKLEELSSGSRTCALWVQYLR